LGKKGSEARTCQMGMCVEEGGNMQGTSQEGASPGNLVAVGFTPIDLISRPCPSLQVTLNPKPQ